MHRLIAILLPFLVVAASAPRQTSNGANGSLPAELGKLWNQSVEAEKSSDLKIAIDHMKSYYQRGGDPFFTNLRLGWLHYTTAEYDKSGQFYRKAASLKPTSLNALLGALSAAQALQDPRQTIQAAEAVLRLQPTNYRAQMVIAGLHYAEEDYRKAAAEYARVLLTYPEDPDALSGVAWAALRMRDKPNAMQAFALLLSMYPDYPSAQEGYDLLNR